MAGELVGSKQARFGPDGKSPKDRAWFGEKILAARNNGQTMPVIAKDLGLSLPTAYRYMDLALALRIPPTVDAYRTQQNDRLDQTQREIQHQIDAANYLVGEAMTPGNVSAPLLLKALEARDRAIALQLRLDERRARLNGLDAPIKVDAMVTQSDPREEELAEMVRQAKAKMAREKSDG